MARRSGNENLPRFEREQDSSTTDVDDIPPPEFKQFLDQDFPDAGEIPIPCVSPLTAHFHLSILRRFCALYDVVESYGATIADKARLVQTFLVSAEARYLKYLTLLRQCAGEIRSSGEQGIYDFSRLMPLPPWDVAIIFHSHCLSPFRFYADMIYRDKPEALWNKGLAFPFERLHLLITNQIWSDPESEEMWNRHFPKTPYQVWNANPTSTTSISPVLQDVDMQCPYCDRTVTINLLNFQKMHVTKVDKCQCPSCDRTFNADDLSAYHLKKDLSNYTRAQGECYVKGMTVDSDGTRRGISAVDDLDIILDTEMQARVGRTTSSVTGTSLARYITLSQPTWKGFITAFQATIRELKSVGKFKKIDRRNIFARLRLAYMGIVYPSLSIDLVAASLRQREFAIKITSAECSGMDSPFALFKATTRYHKFMLLMNRGSKKSFLVPTLDIDLCWHTHQLFPHSYRKWCLEHLHRAVNHDDTIGKGDLNQGMRETSLAWLEAYREPYTTDDLRKGYFSSGRKVAGIICPPYGLHMLNKGRKLDKARTVIGAEQVGQNRQRGVYGDDAYMYSYMYMYPYWTMYPYGWYYPAACAGGYAGIGGWGAGFAENSACGGGACGGGAGGCGSANGGSCGAGGCGGGGGGGGCGGGGCGGGGCGGCGG